MLEAMLDIRNFTRRRPPSFPFEKAQKLVIPGWEVSLVFSGRDRARALNQTLRKKDYVPNVLSYETGRRSGEIIICTEVAKRQAPAYGMPYATFVGFLFIHGCAHLKGLRHGPTMDAYERAVLARVITHRTSPNGPTHRHRH